MLESANPLMQELAGEAISVSPDNALAESVLQSRAEALQRSDVWI
jgi:hypothetical protein